LEEDGSFSKRTGPSGIDKRAITKNDAITSDGYNVNLVSQNMEVCVRLGDYEGAVRSLHRLLGLNLRISLKIVRFLLRDVMMANIGACNPKLVILCDEVHGRFTTKCNLSVNLDWVEQTSYNVSLRRDFWEDLTKILWNMCVSWKSSSVMLLIHEMSPRGQEDGVYPSGINDAVGLFDEMVRNRNVSHTVNGVTYVMRDVILCDKVFIDTLSTEMSKRSHLPDLETLEGYEGIVSKVKASRRIKYYFWWYIVTWAQRLEEERKDDEVAKVARPFVLSLLRLSEEGGNDLSFVICGIQFLSLLEDGMTGGLQEGITLPPHDVDVKGRLLLHKSSINSNLKGPRLQDDDLIFWRFAIKRLNPFPALIEFEDQMYRRITGSMLKTFLKRR
jgi:hypothetical protein